MDVTETASIASRIRGILTVCLLLVAAVGLLLRVSAVAQPLGIDQGLWASAVRGMSRGLLLYRDVWEQRPPGIYFTYLLGFSTLGWTASTLAWLDVIAAALTTILLWRLVHHLLGPLAGAVAAALYALFTHPAWLFSYGGFLERAISETFIIVFLTAAAWCAVRFFTTSRTLFALGVGLASGGAVVMKPNAGVYFPAFIAWMALYTPGARQWTRARVWILAAVAGAAVLPTLTLLWLWQNGLMHDARIAVLDFNRFYVGQGFVLTAYARQFADSVYLRMKTDPIWMAGGIGAAAVLYELATKRRLAPAPGLAVLWGAAAVAMIVANGARFFNSYFLPPYVPLTLLGTWLFVDLARRSSLHRVAAAIVAAMMAIVLVQRDYVARVRLAVGNDLAVRAGQMDRTAYLETFGGYNNRRGFSARANTELADHVRSNTAPDERVFLFGINGATLYFDADRLPAHRFLRVNFFVPSEFPDPHFTLDAVVQELKSAGPRYLIFERLNAVSPRGAEMARLVDNLPQDPRVADLLRGYRLETVIEDFTLYRRLD